MCLVTKLVPVTSKQVNPAKTQHMGNSFPLCPCKSQKKLGRKLFLWSHQVRFSSHIPEISWGGFCAQIGAEPILGMHWHGQNNGTQAEGTTGRTNSAHPDRGINCPHLHPALRKKASGMDLGEKQGNGHRTFLGPSRLIYRRPSRGLEGCLATALTKRSQR